MKGRRIPVEFDEDGNANFPALELAGDYCGPLVGFTGNCPAVYFLKPNARDPDAPRRARSIQFVISPPHVFTENPDGTLTITASIGDTAGPGSESDGWHGFLTAGEWKKC
jgi:hypothetical protein